MAKLYLVRHARTIIVPERHHSEWELDPASQQDLDQLAALPGFAACKQVFSSPEPKALHTAGTICKVHNLPEPILVDALRELHKGSFVPNHPEVMAQVFARPDHPVADGWETAADALHRFRSALEGLVAEHRHTDIMVVSHGVVYVLYLAYLAGRQCVDPADWLAIRMPDMAVVEMDSMLLTQPFGAWRAQG